MVQKPYKRLYNLETASPKIIETLKIFMISAILFKMGNSDFHLSFIQIEGMLKTTH